MIVPGVDIPKRQDWFSQSFMLDKIQETVESVPRSLANPVISFRAASYGSVDSLPIYLTLNPPLINSQIKSPTPNKAPNPLRPTTSRTYATTTNPMAFFGTSVLGIGFGVSLIPQITLAAQGLGLIEDPNSPEYQLGQTL